MHLRVEFSNDKTAKVGLLYRLPDNRPKMAILAVERNKYQLINETLYEIDYVLQVENTVDKAIIDDLW